MSAKPNETLSVLRAFQDLTEAEEPSRAEKKLSLSAVEPRR